MSKTARILRNKNNIFEENLTKKNQDIMTDIVVYLRGADISETQQERIREDIGAMLYEAQQRGENAQKVIGTNYKEFCNEILANVPHETTKEKIIRRFGTIAWMLLFIIPLFLIITMFQNILQNKSWYQIELRLGTILLWAGSAIGAISLVQYVLRHSFEAETRKEKIKIFSIFIIVFMGLILCETLLKQVICTTTLLPYIIGFFCSLIAYFLLDKLEK